MIVMIVFLVAIILSLKLLLNPNHGPVILSPQWKDTLILSLEILVLLELIPVLYNLFSYQNKSNL